ncbi:iron complex outermembrane recepter protein [Flavobacterium saccharophilum]|uniref:Iron complex outermembrane recepter protein n=1 Tax=Flavobacterium saccharophilum TaxID=29534 RepID=A0A1M7AF51_9FLAO|nr:iron complex outermembrane recepter protein [Flavobacterium saccharophilum]
MKKKSKNTGFLYRVFQNDLKLKLTTLLILVAMFNIRGNTYAQKTKVTLELNNSTIEKVIETIEQKTDFRFIYKLNDIDLDRTISINVKDQSIYVVLDKLFKGTPTEFKIRDTQIILKKPELKTQIIEFQKQTVSGIITDENGLPLPGASVLEEGTRNGMVTDFDGKYKITVESSSSVIIVSFVGYKEKKVTANQSIINIQLIPDATDLQEIVVVGYGTTARRDVTGAVSSIGAKDMNQGAIVNPLQLISGKAAGVNINQIGSEPGSGPSVRIRGVSSLIGGSDPLVVVDGIQGNLDLLTSIPPTEIESIDILKDASATAIYGSRGAAGVILVTTKSNKNGKSTIEYVGSTSIDFIPKKLDMLNASEWTAAAAANGVPASSNHGADTDWYGVLTQTGFTQTHTLSFGGGTNKLNYRASLTAISQDGVVINSSNKKYIARVQATQKGLDDKLKLTFNLNNGVETSTRSIADLGRSGQVSNLISQAYLMRPTDPVFDTDGKSYFTDPGLFQYINPYAVAEKTINDSQWDNLFGSLKADLDLADGLQAGWFGSWRKTNSTTGFYLPSSSTDPGAVRQDGFGNISNKRQNEKLMDISLTYKKTFGVHSINALALYEWQNQTYEGSFLQARGFISDVTSYNALQYGDMSKVLYNDINSYKNDRTLASFVARANYTLLDRYLVTASMRRDGSSVFGANNKWGNFPSASVAWQITKESFMSNQTLINELKLRAGYGVTGNQQGLNPQGSLSLVDGAGSTYFGGSQITNFAISQNPNADLKWETKKQTNLGLDFALLDNRLRGTFDVYTATTDNLLFNYTVPQPPYPKSDIKANVGSIRNEGLEVSLGYDVIRNENTTLTLAGNASFMRNEVLNLSGSINGIPLNTDYVAWGGGTPNMYLIKGQPIGTFNILQHEGVNASGVETVVDQNGDGTFDQGARSPDRVMEGSALPTYTFAFNPSLRYKNFDASLLLRGSGGNKVYNLVNQRSSYLENIGKSNVLDSALDKGIRTSTYGSDIWLEDASFIRLENVTAGYNFVFKDRFFESIRLSLTGNNLFLITDYTGIDPEINLNGSNADNAYFGGDRGIYPRTRSVAFGVIVKFK